MVALRQHGRLACLLLALDVDIFNTAEENMSRVFFFGQNDYMSHEKVSRFNVSMCVAGTS